MARITEEALAAALASGRPRLLVLAGPNGAGKTTFHEQFLGKRPVSTVLTSAVDFVGELVVLEGAQQSRIESL